MFHKGSNITRGFGFVTFELKSTLSELLNTNTNSSRHIINHKTVEIKIAVPEK